MDDLREKTLVELKALAEDVGLKRQSIGWPKCCPPSGNKADIISALIPYISPSPAEQPDDPSTPDNSTVAEETAPHTNERKLPPRQQRQASSAKYESMTLAELKQQAERLRIKECGVGWPKCCPPNGNKADIIQALLKHSRQFEDVAAACQSGVAPQKLMPINTTGGRKLDVKQWFYETFEPSVSWTAARHRKGAKGFAIDTRAEITTSFNGTDDTVTDVVWMNARNIMVKIRQAFPRYFQPGTSTTECHGDKANDRSTFQGLIWADRERNREMPRPTEIRDPFRTLDGEVKYLKEWQMGWLHAARNAKAVLCFISTKTKQSKNTRWEFNILEEIFDEDDIAYISVEDQPSVVSQLNKHPHAFNWAGNSVLSAQASAIVDKNDEAQVLARLCRWVGERIGQEPQFPVNKGIWKHLESE